MRLAWTAWALVFVGFVLYPGTELGGALAAVARFACCRCSGTATADGAPSSGR